MWSLFSRDPAKDFAYEVGDAVPGLTDQSIWTLHQGKRKSSGEPVSIFVFDLKSSSESQVAVAKSAQRRIKTLRHPNMLTYLDGLESEKVLYVVTESVIPLEKYIQNNETKSKQNELAVSWGLHRIAKALSFLNNDCNLIHNNVCEASVFVDQAGEWRLGAVDYMYPASGEGCLPPVKILPTLEKYDPPEKTGGGGRFKPTEKWSTDMWGLGCLIWEIFNGHLPKTSSLKTLGNIPKSLVPHYCQLVGANPKSRPNPAKFIENCTSRGGFMDNKFVATMLFLEEIQIKESNEKGHFFNGLSPVLDSFPETFCKYKILPQLIHAFEYGNAGSAVLQPLFKLGRLLDAEEYQKKIVPCIVKLFSSTDRATRVKLLQQVEFFVEHLTPDVVNTKIYPNICQGFMDTNPVVREHTIKSILHLAAKLNYKNMNEDLLKHFARLQAKDDQGGIRTNTTVCLGKVAGHINPQLRQKVLCSAYLRAMKDPFPPARQAGIVAMAATHHFFTLKESANRLLPALCTMTLDPEKVVRDQAFKAIRCFMGKLEKVSEDPDLTQELERDVNSGSASVSSAASWAGWAMSGVMSNFTAKIYKGKGQQAASTDQTAKSATVGDVKGPETSQPDTDSRQESSPDTPQIAEGTGESSQKLWNSNDGWEEDGDWGNMEDENEAPSGEGWEHEEDEEEETEEWGSLSEQPGAVNKDEQSPWGSADFAPVSDTQSNLSSNYNWGGQDPDSDDFFTSMLDSSKKKGSRSPGAGLFGATSKPSTLDTQVSSHKNQASNRTPSNRSKPPNQPPVTKAAAGWDDMGWDNKESWDSSAGSDGVSKADQLKRDREEKRAQRQREIEEKRSARQASGGMKLGTRKKTALD